MPGSCRTEGALHGHRERRTRVSRPASRTRRSAQTAQRPASRMPPRRLPVRVPTIAELNPSPSRTEHLGTKTEHFQRKTEHFRPETEHIAPETEHIGRQSGHFRPKTGHIHCQSGHIGGQIEHLSTQTSAMTPRRAPSAPESPTTSHSPLPVVITSCTLVLPPPAVPESPCSPAFTISHLATSLRRPSTHLPHFAHAPRAPAPRRSPPRPPGIAGPAKKPAKTVSGQPAPFGGGLARDSSPYHPHA